MDASLTRRSAGTRPDGTSPLLDLEKQDVEAEQHLLRARDIRAKTLGPDARVAEDSIAELGNLYAA
jgi:hypothetical protein